jgi:ankyrin repeat protein
MKQILLTTIAAVVLVGCGVCGPSEAERALVGAAESGNIEAVKQHIAAGTDVNAKDRMVWTPLHRAAQQGHKEIAELLITNNADVNMWAANGRTPLHEAARYGHKEVVELLIAKGADVNAKKWGGDYTGDTPLDTAIRRKHPETADLLRKHGGKTGEELKAEGK